MRPTTLSLQPQFADGAEGADDRAAAAHVVVHFVHFGRRLQRNAAGVEGDGLADQHHRLVALFAAFVLQHDEARRLVAALADRQEGAHAEFFAGGVVENFAAEAVGFRHFLRFAGQVFRRADVGRRIAQVLGEIDAVGNRQAACQPGIAELQFAAPRHRKDHALERAAYFARLAFHVVEAVQRVVGADHGLLDVPGDVAFLDRNFGERDGRFHRAGVAQGLDGAGDGVAIGLFVEVALLAEAHQQDAVGQDVGHLVQQQGAAGLAFHVAAAQDFGQVAVAGAVDVDGRLRQLAVFEHADHHAGGALLFGRAAFYAKFKFDFLVFHVCAQKNTICR